MKNRQAEMATGYAHLVELLKDQVRPALGCTEPACIGVACARAFAEVPGEIREATVRLSLNMFKNANGVGIPGTSECGVPFAVALGLVCGDAEQGLEVFSGVTGEAVAAAQKLVAAGSIRIHVMEDETPVFVEAIVTTSKGVGRCVIRHGHTRIERVERDGVRVFPRDCGRGLAGSAEASDCADCAECGQVASCSRSPGECTHAAAPILEGMSLADLRRAVEVIPLAELAFLIVGVPMNNRIAQAGLDQRPGLGLGAALRELMAEGSLEVNLVNKARMYAAAAADARMAGINMPVMSCAGSGNHGIMAVILPYVVCKELELDEEKLIRGLALSHLVTIAITEFSGRLTPSCGCALAAGVGASVAVAWLMGCNDEQMAGVVNSMIGSLAGVLCDGAKGGCAFKLSAAAGEAVLCALLANKGVHITWGQGISGIGPETTIRNIAQVCGQGMKQVDREVVGLILGQ